MIVGLTGGIGSGKTTVARIFSHLRMPVYEADAESKKLIDTDKDLQAELQKLLGDELVKDGKVDRAFMAKRIFNDKELLNQTNGLIHPAVARDFKKWHQKQNAHYVIREAAILFESGSYRDCDRVVVVAAPKELRIKRVMARNGSSREEVLQRMAHQWPEQTKLDRADYVVHNDHSQSIIKQVIAIHEDLIRQAKQRS